MTDATLTRADTDCAVIAAGAAGADGRGRARTDADWRARVLDDRLTDHEY
jgi:hypothetical protein